MRTARCHGYRATRGQRDSPRRAEPRGGDGGAMADCPSSGPPELVEAVVVDAVEVADLVHERGVDLVTQLVLGLARGEVRQPEHDDPVGKLAEAVPAAVGEVDALVASQ